ncbi:riboflavin synthase [Chlorobium sp.]|uniref:riboflavin synthase n=1 Tax=Chlorobium sp. TaxID=1095 RepID=UPI003C405319
MFTGIVKDIGKVGALERRNGGLRLRVQYAGMEAFASLSVDESVSVNGVCQTVVAVADGWFEVDTVEETLAKTTLGSLRCGASVNLERALRPMDRLGGHFVLGHVDCVGVVKELRELGSSREIWFSYPEEFSSIMVSAGSVAIDGISLTVARLGDASFAVAVIPFTFRHTTISALAVGSRVNLEFDILGKYVARQLSLSASSPFGASRLDEAWLRENGF